MNNHRWTDPFASLKNRNFRLFSTGLLFAFVALQMQSLTLNYLVYNLTNSATTIGYVNALTGLSILFFSFAGGIAADRFSRRNLLIATQLGIGLATLVLAILISAKLVVMQHVYIFAVLYGIMGAINIVARQSYIPDMVGTNALTNASGLVSANMSLTRIIGPALGGFLLSAGTAAPAFYVKAVCQSMFAVFLLFIPLKGLSPARPSSIIGDAIEGIRYLRRDSRVLDLLLLGTIPIILGAPYVNFLPVFQQAVFKVSAAKLGLMMSVTGIGAIIGSLAIAALNHSRRKAVIQFVTGTGFGAALMLFGITAKENNFGVSLAMLGFVGMSGTAFAALNIALVQSITPPEMQGRIQALFTAGVGLMALGSLPMGMLVDSVGPSQAMMISGGLAVIFVVLMTAVRPALRLRR